MNDQIGLFFSHCQWDDWLIVDFGTWDEDPFGDDPVKGVIGGMVAAVLFLLIAYRQSNRIYGPAVNAQFDVTAEQL